MVLSVVMANALGPMVLFHVVVRLMVISLVKIIVSLAAVEFARMMAARKLPKPESLSFVTVKMAGTSRGSRDSSRGRMARFFLKTWAGDCLLKSCLNQFLR